MNSLLGWIDCDAGSDGSGKLICEMLQENPRIGGELSKRMCVIVGLIVVCMIVSDGRSEWGIATSMMCSATVRAFCRRPS